MRGSLATLGDLESSMVPSTPDADCTSPMSLHVQRQTSMAHDELQCISLIMVVYGELILFECHASVNRPTYGFLGSLALMDEQPRECAQRVVGDALSHRSRSEWEAEAH